MDEAATPAPESLNLADYSREVFRMYDTEKPIEVSLLCENGLMKHLIDHFGLNVKTEIVDDEHIRAKVLVCTSPTFYRWVFGWCGRMKIEGPDSVREEYRRMAQIAFE